MKLFLIFFAVLIAPLIFWAWRAIGIGTSTKKALDISRKEISDLYRNELQPKERNCEMGKKERDQH